MEPFYLAFAWHVECKESLYRHYPQSSSWDRLASPATFTRRPSTKIPAPSRSQFIPQPQGPIRQHSAFKMGSRSPSQASSPLSNIDSDSYEADYYQQHMSGSHMPAAKRQRLDEGSLRATPASHGPDFDALSSISSDTSGDVPMSPSAARVDDEDAYHEQVTLCAWEGCHGGDFGNMDGLVAHIHNNHIEGRGKRYTCEWEFCSRKSHAHASAYALKAHMRSHTREKPFYCALPGKSTSH